MQVRPPPGGGNPFQERPPVRDCRSWPAVASIHVTRPGQPNAASRNKEISMDWIHALAVGLLIGLIYFLVEKIGILEGKSLGRKMLILLPLYFIAILTLNLLWPGGWPD